MENTKKYQNRSSSRGEHTLRKCWTRASFLPLLGSGLIDGWLTLHRRAIDTSTTFLDSAQHGDIKWYQTFWNRPRSCRERWYQSLQISMSELGHVLRLKKCIFAYQKEYFHFLTPPSDFGRIVTAFKMVESI